LKLKTDDIAKAIEGSTEVEVNSDNSKIRRKDNAPLPK